MLNQAANSPHNKKGQVFVVVNVLPISSKGNWGGGGGGEGEARGGLIANTRANVIKLC